MRCALIVALGAAGCSGNFVAVSAGHEHSCAIRDDDSVVCWGNSWPGSHDLPRDRSWAEVSAGFWVTCARDLDGNAECAGLNQGGNTVVPEGRTWSRIAVNKLASDTCAIDEGGRVDCWDIAQEMTTETLSTFRSATTRHARSTRTAKFVAGVGTASTGHVRRRA